MDPHHNLKFEPDSAWRYLFESEDADFENCLQVRYTALNYELDRLAVEKQREGCKTKSGQFIGPWLRDWQWNAILGGDYFPVKSFLQLPKEARSRVSSHFQKTILTVYETALSGREEKVSGKKKALREAVWDVVGMAYDFQLACTIHQSSSHLCTGDVSATTDLISNSNFCGPYVPVVPTGGGGEELPPRFRDLTKKRQNDIIEKVCKSRRWLHAVLRSNRCRLLGRAEAALSLEGINWSVADHQALDAKESAADFEAAAAAGLLSERRYELLPWRVSVTVGIDLRFPKSSIMREFEEQLEILVAEGRQKGKPISTDLRPADYYPEQRLKQLALVRLHRSFGTVDSAKDWLAQHPDWGHLKALNRRKQDSADVLAPGTWSKAKNSVMELLERR